MKERDHRRERYRKGGKIIRILLADDHRILRSGLRSLLEKQPGFEIVAEAADGREAIQKSVKLKPDVVILDISMPDLNGVEAARQIIDKSPHTKIVILSVHSDRRFVAEVFKAGASGYLLKDCDYEELVAGVHAVIAGKTYLCPRIASVVRDDYLRHLTQDESSVFSILTVREREVLQLMAEGRSTKEIAFSFNLSVKTIESHRQRIMEKLDIHNIAELTKYAVREGLTSLEP